jgi:hypothetical protein
LFFVFLDKDPDDYKLKKCHPVRKRLSPATAFEERVSFGRRNSIKRQIGPGIGEGAER